MTHLSRRRFLQGTGATALARAALGTVIERANVETMAEDYARAIACHLEHGADR